MLVFAFQNINYPAVLVCTVLAFAIGWMWYSVPVFGRIWMAGIPTIPAAGNDTAMKAMSISFITTLMEMMALNMVILLAGAATVSEGVQIGALVSAGFILMVLISNAMYETRPLSVLSINAGYRIVYYLVNGGIFAVWQ